MTENLNNHLIINAIEIVTKTLPQRKVQAKIFFTAKFYQRFKDEIMSICDKFFQKIELVKILPNSFYEGT